MKYGKFYITFFIFLLFSGVLYGQFGAKFFVESDIGCAPFTVSVIDSSEAPPGNVNVYDYGETGTVTQDTFYTYTTPGIYTITQTVPNGNPRDTSLTIEVVAPSTPMYNLSNCKGTEAFFHGDDTLYKAFWVDWGDGNSEIVSNKQITQHDYGVLGSFNVTVQGLMDPSRSETELANVNCSSSFATLNLIADIVPGTIDRIEALNQESLLLNFTVNNQTSYYLEVSINGSASFSIIDTLSVNSLPPNYIVDNLNTSANYYCFRLTAFDPCDGATTPSPIACSVQASAIAVNNENQLTWNTETGDLNSFDINRNGSFLTTTSLFQYQDTDVECGINYCYQVTMNENSGLESISNSVCVTAISNDIPPSISDVNASIVNGQVELSWEPPSTTPLVYYIDRTEEGGINESSFTASTNNFSDSAATPDTKRYYYEIYYEDLCGNDANPVTASPVFLSEYLTPTIRWANYLGWQSSVNTYLLEIYDENGQLLQTIDVGLDTVYTEQDLQNIPQELIYRIIARPSVSGINEVYSNFLSATFPSNVVFPNAFTPNGDGLNDIFTYTGLFISNFRMMIYNRWGEIIFETDNPDNGWDGTKNSVPVPSGMYIFNAEFTDEAGISFVKKGEVYLLR